MHEGETAEPSLIRTSSLSADKNQDIFPLLKNLRRQVTKAFDCCTHSARGLHSCSSCFFIIYTSAKFTLYIYFVNDIDCFGNNNIWYKCLIIIKHNMYRKQISQY